MTIVDALKRFNRKERYWLLRNALGSASGKLGQPFLAELGAALGGIQIPKDAWWAMDYHLDWLVGALALSQESATVGKAELNPAALVRGNQEDIDLVVAFGTTLILIEAKADTSWSNAQLNSKVDRLEAILGDGLSGQSGAHRPSVYFVLMSPRKPGKLIRTNGRTWPTWMMGANEQPFWTPLLMAEEGQTPNFLKVVRCSDEKGIVSSEGSHWKIQELRSGDGAP